MFEYLREMKGDAEGGKFSGKAKIMVNNLEQCPPGLTITWGWEKRMVWRYHNRKQNFYMDGH